jgi:CheY-like chemotaxis protein/glycine cleavage system H lipoate-binding protein
MIYKANILVVDDDLSVCKSVAAVFKNESCTVDTVNNGEDALEKVKEKNYALVIVDLMMPGISGLDVIKKLKKNKPDLTVIMITGYPSIKTAVKAIKIGAYDYIPKPFTPGEIRSLVARALEKRHNYEEISGKLGIKEEKLVDISLPDGLYGIPDHSWVKIEEDGNVRIGIHHALISAVHDLDTIEFPDKNEMRYQGEACVRFIDSQNQVLRLWTPVTGKVIDINEELNADFSKLLQDPYGEGWLITIEPDHLEEDLQNLVSLRSS